MITYEFIDVRGNIVAGHRYQNLDGSIGGWVADTAGVHWTATIRDGGLVGPGAVVGPREIVLSGEFKCQEKK